MTVKDIVIKALKDQGYDGLYTPGECGCEIDDLAPCDSTAVLYCQSGYKRLCRNCPVETKENCEFDSLGEWCISKNKQMVEEEE